MSCDALRFYETNGLLRAVEIQWLTGTGEDSSRGSAICEKHCLISLIRVS